jgi:hypothetical protein
MNGLNAWESNEQRAMKARGTGRWVVEWWNDEKDKWGQTIWRGISIDAALTEMKRLMEEFPEWTFRARHVDTNQEIPGELL